MIPINYLIDFLTTFVTNNYDLALLGSGGLAILVVLFLLLKRKPSNLDYSKVVNTLNCDFKIGISQVEEVEDLATKQKLILQGQEDLKPETYLQVLDILVDDQLLKNLLQQVTGTDVATKKRAARTLLKIGTPQAVDYTVPLLYDENEEVKTLVINKLAELKQSKVVSILINYLDYCNNVLIQENLIKAFRTLGSKSIPKLLELIEEGSSHSNWIIELLGEIGGEEVVNPLLEILEQSPTEKIKISVVKSLAEFPDQPEVFSALLKRVEDSSCNVRAQVAKLLGKFDREETYDCLYNLLTDSSGIVRKNAAESLLQLGEAGIKYLILAVEEGETSQEIVNCLERVDAVKLISLVREGYQNQVLEGDSATLELVEQGPEDEKQSNQKLIG